MVNWDNEKEQTFWIKVIIAIISSVILYFLMQSFPTFVVKTYFFNFFTFLFLICLLIAFIIPSIVILIFNKLRNTERPSFKTMIFYRTETFILVYTLFFTILFILNIG